MKRYTAQLLRNDDPFTPGMDLVLALLFMGLLLFCVIWASQQVQGSKRAVGPELLESLNDSAFDVGDAKLKVEVFVALKRRAAEWRQRLAEDQHLHIRLLAEASAEGHGNGVNVNLSLDRAKSVAAALLSGSVPESCIQVYALGNSHSLLRHNVEDPSNPELSRNRALALDRRVQIQMVRDESGRCLESFYKKRQRNPTSSYGTSQSR